MNFAGARGTDLIAGGSNVRVPRPLGMPVGAVRSIVPQVTGLHLLIRSAQRLSFGSAPAKLVGQRFAIGRKGKADRVDAVALAGRRRSVGKDVALVRPATRTDNLRPDHAVAGVGDIFEVIDRERLGE